MTDSAPATYPLLLACTREGFRPASAEPDDITIDVRPSETAPAWFVRAGRQTEHLAWGRPANGPDSDNLAPGSIALVREGCGAPAGAGRADVTAPGVVTITAFGVLADMRGLGVGTALARALTTAAFDGGAATCQVLAADSAQEQLFREIGFRPAGDYAVTVTEAAASNPG